MSAPNLISTKSVKLKVRAVLKVIAEDLAFMAKQDPQRKAPNFNSARYVLRKIRKKLREEFYL